MLVDVPAFERIVQATVIDRFDHKNLNVELPEFRDADPQRREHRQGDLPAAQAQVRRGGAKLARVTVWETPKTWCEYSE